VKPWVADAFPAAVADWQCEVTALELPRTFWEKATILHAEHHRPPEQQMPDRYARHYADTARLLRHAEAAGMLADRAMCERVVTWKSQLFARQWARYDLAVPGHFRWVPPAERIDALARDYALMRPMFLTPPSPFEEILQQLATAEKTFNAFAPT